MTKNAPPHLHESEESGKRNKGAGQHLKDVHEDITPVKTGGIDALVIADEKALKVYTEDASDKIYRLLIEKMHEGAVTLNAKGMILYCNSCFAKMVNRPLQKVMGKIFNEFVEESSKDRFELLVGRGRMAAVKDEILLLANKGKTVPVQMSLNSLLLHDETVLSVILTDLTTQNRNQKELQHIANQLLQKNFELEMVNKELAFQNEEKERRSVELNAVNKKLAIQNREKERRTAELLVANGELEAFNYLSSHDLQEPLRKIQIFAALILEEEKLSDNGKNNFGRIRSAAGRMRQLINDLMDYSRMRNSEIKFVKTDLNMILEEVRKELEYPINEKQAIVEFNELSHIPVIPFQFRQLMLNLIGNSLKFSKPGIKPHIVIDTKIEKGTDLENKKLMPKKLYCRISVKDNGIGFESHFSERVFEVFKKLHTKDIYEGTGIGLAIVKKIVENHRGLVTVTSAINKGARFDIFIPLA